MPTGRERRERRESGTCNCATATSVRTEVLPTGTHNSISDLVEAAHSQLGAVHRGPQEAVVYRGPQEAVVHMGPQGAGPVRRGLRGVGHSRNLGVEAGSRRVGEVELRMGHTAGSLGEGRGNKKYIV